MSAVIDVENGEFRLRVIPRRYSCHSSRTRRYLANSQSGVFTPPRVPSPELRALRSFVTGLSFPPRLPSSCPSRREFDVVFAVRIRRERGRRV